MLFVNGKKVTVYCSFSMCKYTHRQQNTWKNINIYPKIYEYRRGKISHRIFTYNNAANNNQAKGILKLEDTIKEGTDDLKPVG